MSKGSITVEVIAVIAGVVLICVAFFIAAHLTTQAMYQKDQEYNQNLMTCAQQHTLEECKEVLVK